MKDKTEAFARLVFDVVMSLFAFYFMKLEFQPSFLFFVELLLNIFFKESNPDGKFRTHHDAILSFDDSANLLFWTFKAFAERFLIPSQKCIVPSKAEFFIMVQSILSNISPSTAVMLESRGITNFDFCENEIRSFFLRERTAASKALLLTALVVNENPGQFLEYCLCALLVLLQGRLQQIEGIDTFKKSFNGLVPSVESRLLLYNVENLMATLHSADASPE
jgi:hypothetical protein